MPIQILPPRLANQIAAGEVVERPASVVKELLENSLDAGADQIQIEIERGGHKLIRIRDNGSGIDRSELTLALSRHATSKVSSLDDLEAIVSLGFRGEALASISSVSRLTLTSRPTDQSEAWQAHAEGREMEVQIQPASHPPGTTLEVRDLFFNTPARRRFLRTEKTEFQHIDEVIRRIALCRFDISVQLKHNGKLVRNYRAGTARGQQENRIASVLGRSFMQNALHIELTHHGMRLHGWLSTPAGARAQADQQFSYVNGRMMRDKVVQHAVRQAYADFLGGEQYPAYLLYLELDPHEVDVNVHPAKHEVRFHQSRLVHDFIVTALLEALSSAATPAQLLPAETQLSEPASPGYAPSPLRPSQQNPIADASGAVPGGERAGPFAGRGRTEHRHAVSRDTPSAAASEAYQTLMTPAATAPTGDMSAHAAADQALPVPASSEGAASASASLTPLTAAQPQQVGELRLLACYRCRYQLVERGGQLELVSLERIEAQLLSKRMAQSLAQQSQEKPLLVPIRLQLTEAEQQALLPRIQVFLQLGIEICQPAPHKVMIRKVPALLRHSGIADWLPELLRQLDQQGDASTDAFSVQALLPQVAAAAVRDRIFSEQEIPGLLQQAADNFTPATWRNCSIPAPIEAWIKGFDDIS